jgi:hypothetical protein
MPQWHVRKHPDLKQLIFTTQMKHVILKGHMQTSTERATRLLPVLERTISQAILPDTKPELKEAIRTRFWVGNFRPDSGL